MELDGKKIVVSSFSSETLDQDLIIFNETHKKIVLLNHTAVVVWKIILENVSTSGIVTSSDVVNTVMTLYQLPESETSTVFTDVQETIAALYESSLIQELTDTEDPTNAVL